jgi:hypothetical protein
MELDDLEAIVDRLQASIRGGDLAAIVNAADDLDEWLEEMQCRAGA